MVPGIAPGSTGPSRGSRIPSRSGRSTVAQGKEFPMPRLAHLGLAVLGAALAVPGSARAGDNPPAASPSSPAAPAPAAAPAPGRRRSTTSTSAGSTGAWSPARSAPRGRTAQGSTEMAGPRPAAVAVAPAAPWLTPHNHGPIPTAGMPEGSRIVGCAHSSNGVCATCKALLEMPGEVMMVTPGMARRRPSPRRARPRRGDRHHAGPGRGRRRPRADRRDADQLQRECPGRRGGQAGRPRRCRPSPAAGRSWASSTRPSRTSSATSSASRR